MEKDAQQILEVVLFLKEHAEKMERNMEGMATKEDLNEGLNSLRSEFKTDINRLEKHILGHQNRMGAIDKSLDDEVFARRDLENRVRTVLPSLPQAAL